MYFPSARAQMDRPIAPKGSPKWPPRSKNVSKGIPKALQRPSITSHRIPKGPQRMFKMSRNVAKKHARSPRTFPKGPKGSQRVPKRSPQSKIARNLKDYLRNFTAFAAQKNKHVLTTGACIHLQFCICVQSLCVHASIHPLIRNCVWRTTGKKERKKNHSLRVLLTCVHLFSSFLMLCLCVYFLEFIHT